MASGPVLCHLLLVAATNLPPLGTDNALQKEIPLRKPAADESPLVTAVSLSRQALP